MQQIKIFTSESAYKEGWVSADDKANKWLSENPQVRVSGFADSGVSASDFHESICLLYEISDIVITSRTEVVPLSDKRYYSSEKYEVDFG